MNVEQLICILQKMPQDAPVILEFADGRSVVHRDLNLVENNTSDCGRPAVILGHQDRF